MNGDKLVGIPLANQPYVGFSEMSFSGSELSSVGTSATVQKYSGNTSDYGDDFTWEHGNHITEVGVQLRRYQQNNYYPGNDGGLGLFSYSGQFTSNPNLSSSSAPGFPFADFTLDQSISEGTGGVAGPYGQRQYRSAFYVQDDWKVRTNLVFNLGLRYGFDQPIYEVN